MALKNAFSEIATEFTLRKLLDQLRFAKDSADRLRVTVDNVQQVTTYMNNSTTSIVGGATPSPYGTGTWNIMDARAEFQELSLQATQIQRNRWTIT